MVAAGTLLEVVPIPGIQAIGANLILTGALTLVGAALAGKAPKPDTTLSSKRQPIPPRIRAYGRSRLHAYYALYETSADGSAVDVLAFMDGKADAIEQVYLNDDKVTVVNGIVQQLADKQYQMDKVRVGYTLGQTPNTAFSVVSSYIPSWTAQHRGDGVVTGYLVKKSTREKFYLETYPQGDNVEMSLVGRWQVCLDPRTGNTAWTENPVLHTLDYMTRIRGYDYDKRIAPALQYWIDAANVCDEAVALKVGGTEKRYRSCVSYSATAAEKEVLASLLETFDGWIQERGDGAFVIYAGKVTTPTVTIDAGDIISSSIQNFVEAESLIDQVKVTYISAAHDYNEVETTPWGGEDGATRIGTVDAQTPSYSQNRRLAKRLMARTNAANRGTITTGLSGRRVRGHRYIYLNHVEGEITFYSGIAEITSIKRDFQQGGVTFEWIAADQNIDAWNPATEEGEPAAKEDRVAPQPLTPPAINSVDIIYAAATDEGTGTRLQANVAGPVRDDLTWYLRWKRTENAVWNEDDYPDLDASAAVQLLTGFVPANASIDLEAEYRQGDGRLSGWSETYTVDTSTDAAPPDNTANPTILDWRTTLRIQTDKAARARSYVWRIYRDDGTTLIRTITTTTNVMEYTPSQAAADGTRRSYVIKVAAANSAGESAPTSTGVINNPAPPQVQNVVATGGDYIAKLTFDALTDPDLAGYVIFYAKTAGFDPKSAGFAELRGIATEQELYSLGSGTYYARVAGYDGWSSNPAILNLSPEVSFTINSGSPGGTGGVGGGVGGGGAGGGGNQDNVNS